MSFLCDGCQRSSISPLDSLRTDWQYRLNELAAKTFDQGTLAHLLLARLRLTDWSLGRDNMLGMYPGIHYWPSDTPGERHEIDYVELRNGTLIVGECKTGAFRGPLDQVEALARLAKRLNSSEVVLLSSGAPVPDEFRAGVSAHFSGEVTLYGPVDAFDCYPGDRDPRDPEAYLASLRLDD